MSNFQIGYMHNVCLGVVRKLLNCWNLEPLSMRLGNRKVTLISQHLIFLSQYFSVEFNRKPRGLDLLPRWKATQFRTFLLYWLFLYQKTHINIWLCICCSLSEYFCVHCQHLYVKLLMVYNVHMLSHLSDDAVVYGTVDSFSAFTY